MSVNWPMFAGGILDSDHIVVLGQGGHGFGGQVQPGVLGHV